MGGVDVSPKLGAATGSRYADGGPEPSGVERVVERIASKS
jgi:hypothetical protein